jgi:hypothetical protein
MSAERRFRRLIGSILLLAAVLAAAGGLHNHVDLARIAAAGMAPAGGERVLSNHSPHEKASHWHSVVRVQDHSCLACHTQRFAAVASRSQSAAPSEVGLFQSHAGPAGFASAFRLSDPTRGPPTVS